MLVLMREFARFGGIGSFGSAMQDLLKEVAKHKAQDLNRKIVIQNMLDVI